MQSNTTTPHGEEDDVIRHTQFNQEEYNKQLMIWGLGCGLFSLFIFFIATCQYFRKRASTPKAKKLRRMKAEEKKRAEEEKRIQAIRPEPTSTSTFQEVFQKKKKTGQLEIEFKALKRFQNELTCDIALLPENKLKNSVPDCLPYDQTRVVLTQLPGEAGSDYINATYIDSTTKRQAYIAAQGPTRLTVEDFWRMIWQERVQCIVMATNVFEHARQQCEKYWHNQHARYGCIDVWTEGCDNLSEFSIRTFRIKKDGENEERLIKHVQFSSWSDHEVPNPSSVLEYRRKIRVFTRGHDAPLLVHCGGGCGRTGTFIAIDSLVEELDTRNSVDIFSTVLKLRNARPHMVATLDQYKFIYDVIAVYLRCGVTVITASELPTVIRKLAMKDQQTRMNGFEREYKTLQQVVPKLSVGECAGGHRKENRRKSRDIMLQPPERARPYLITHDSNESTDYINAVYVDGYAHPNAYIVTQWPLSSTINDIWRLLYDYNVNTLVLLNDFSFSKNPVINMFQSYPRFWPNFVNAPKSYGPLTVEMLSEEDHKQICVRKFKVRKSRVDNKVMEELISETTEKFKDFTRNIESCRGDVVGTLMEAGEVTLTCLSTLVSLQTLGTQVEEQVKVIKMFQLKCWPSNHKVPSSATSVIQLLTMVEDWKMEGHGCIPTCVLSKDGVSRCGFYCSISMTWEKLKAEGEVDIFRAVKIVKNNRPQLVCNVIEYICCYTFILTMIQLMSKIPVSAISSYQTPWEIKETTETPAEPQRLKGVYYINKSLDPGPYEQTDLAVINSPDTNPVSVFDLSSVSLPEYRSRNQNYMHLDNNNSAQDSFKKQRRQTHPGSNKSPGLSFRTKVIYADSNLMYGETEHGSLMVNPAFEPDDTDHFDFSEDKLRGTLYRNKQSVREDLAKRRSSILVKGDRIWLTQQSNSMPYFMDALSQERQSGKILSEKLSKLSRIDKILAGDTHSKECHEMAMHSGECIHINEQVEHCTRF